MNRRTGAGERYGYSLADALLDWDKYRVHGGRGRKCTADGLPAQALLFGLGKYVVQKDL